MTLIALRGLSLSDCKYFVREWQANSSVLADCCIYEKSGGNLLQTSFPKASIQCTQTSRR